MKFKPEECEKVYALAEEHVGSCQQGRYRREILVSNLERRCEELNIHSLDEYYQFAKSDSKEWGQMLSALSIHTTSWFRESPHYSQLESCIKEFIKEGNNRKFRFWSSACSTGEEVYSAGLLLEYYRLNVPSFDYELLGSDIDPVSVQCSERAIYSADGINSIPERFLSLVLCGTGKTKGFLTIDKEIRKRSEFKTKNLLELDSKDYKFDWIFCRNVLIYIAEENVKKIVENLSKLLNPGGILCLGHSEAQEKKINDLISIGRACYQKTSISTHRNSSETVHSKIILVIDDSVVIRKLLRKNFEKQSWKVIEAESAAEADMKLSEFSFNLITLDLRMEGEDGISWLKRFRTNGNKTPVIILSDSDPKEAEIVFGALETGAQDYVLKSSLNKTFDDFILRIQSLMHSDSNLISIAHLTKTSKLSKDIKVEFDPEVILIGASTGGPEVLQSILKDFGTLDVPPIVVVQHINPTFARPFAERLATAGKFTISQPIAGAPLLRRHIYLAFTDEHIGIQRSDNKITLKIDHSEKIKGHRPAVDYLFHSAAECQVKNISILLTGMGSDGALGLKALHDRGNSLTIAQDEASSTVYGMPKEAHSMGAVNYSANQIEIRSFLFNHFDKSQTKEALLNIKA